uniref:CHD3-type chromatin-remodeling factor PICKLE n=1 Tax=Anthurium amnicola TaxID=1678845 RepID=A0A1D1YFN8_9ARAE
MKESSSTHNKMIDRNWVLKRKRKRISCGLDLSKKKEGISLECSGINPSLKHNTNIPRPRQKIKGNDGSLQYYYECVECDLGGKLLCCDCCPRTYHLECLKPPLKSPPLGKWQCPNCCDQKDSVKLLSLSHVDPVSKRARTKLTGGKSKTEHGLSGSEKSSLVGQSSILGKYKPANKGKSILSHIPSSTKKKSDYTHLDLSTSTKSSRTSGGGNRDGMLVPCGKKLSSAFDWKYSSPRKEVQSPVKNLDAEASDSSPDRKSNICENGSLGNELIPSFSQSIQKTRRRQKDKRGDKKKKSISEKDKRLVVTIQKPSMKKSSSRTEIGGPRPKRGSMVQRVPASMEDPRVQREPQGSPDRTSKPLRAVAEQENEVEKMLECDITFLDEAQQVDRILGCRLQGSDTTFSSHTAQIEVTSTPEHTESEKNSINLTGPGISNAEDVKDMPENKCPHPVSEIGPVTEVHNNVIGFGDHVDKASKTRGCIQGSENINLLKDSVDYHDTSKKDDKLLKEIGNPGNIEVNIEKPLENSDMELATEDIHNNLEHTSCSFTITSKSEDINGVTTESQPNILAEKRTSEGKVVDFLPEDKVNVAYEFLVKWVGQSNIHNSWVPESQLKILAKRKLENYKAKYGTTVINICQEQWTQPKRVIGLRDSKDDKKEAFIKWSGLPYDECTWETLDEPVVKKFPHLISEFNQFESQALDNAKDSSSRASGDVQEVLPLVEQPRELKGGSLFPHQLEALNWLRKCWHKSKNVILADEMGLGKTVSACAFISSLYFEFKAKLPCLVLVPLSTMPNWLAEFSLWAPHLNVVEYHGCAKARSIIRQYEWHASDPNGNKITAAYKFNVLLTTYEMVLADASHLRGVSWEVLVVDEGHRLKNSGSKLFSMLNTFSFQHRILLTGTPLQNNIGEMYNLLNFLQPVSFPSLSAFEEKFNDLTTAEKVEELKKLVAPHMLRRLKKDAMQNIPPKTERMVPVELTSIQAEYYRAMLTKNYQILRNMGKGVAQQSMLNIVMQLRKVCNHPYLIPGTEPDSGSVEFLHEMRIKASGKLTLLHSMLKILHKEGHRILIFSQMTKLLDILEDYLTIEYGPKTFERVDGSVSVADRQLAISRFNQDKTRFVFLLSTRSCGLGINLATADTVIIYDSDFNPHADIQAMNRAHRIGQSNRLLVYRLVVRASVEERILQLAKRKLMLDQLFVNKSETQKEVEDILRWGTEELFSDSDGMGANDQNETCNIKTEAVADGDLRHRRRAGGLGDVYQDRCTDGGNRIVWDESAILKLLDRSNLQAGALESTDVDLENDMLGSVKSLEWNDDLTEEQGGGESLPNIVGDGGVQTSDAKEDNLVTNTEENEWDRLLRVRWEKYQSEEEAALGRGKRLRKAVSYKESFATIPCDALSESGNEEDEPEPEYTPAGRAFKAKFAKLRARQKERLAQRRITELACSTENQSGADVQPQVVPPPVKEAEGLDAGKPVNAVSDHVSSADLGESKMIQTSEALNLRDGSARVGKFPKHGHRRFHLDPSARPPETLSPDMLLPPRKLHSTGFANSLPNSDHLPVLGLCAPNASFLDPKSRKFHSFLGLPMPSFEERSSGMNLQEVPSPSSTVPVPSYIVNLNDGANTMDASLLPELFSGTSDRNTKNSIPGNYFPFDPCPPATSQGKGPELKSHSDILPSLSLDGKMENVNVPLQDLPSLPMLPNFNQHMNENIMQKHVRDLLPTLALGQMQPTLSSLPENHRKVLDSIMMRTGSGSSKLSKKRQKVETWSEDELDALWIGVRRHGRGNWDAMLRDSKLKFSKYRSSDDLSARWAEEQLKILDGPILPTPKSMKSTFPSISDGMMTRALISSRFASLGMEPPKFHSHLTDIQLGCGDLMAGPPSSDQTDHFSSMAKSCPSFLPWQPELFSADFVAGPSDRSTSSNLPVEKTLQHNSLSCSNLNSVGMKCSVSPDSLKGEDVLCANKYRKLPSLLDSSLSMLQDFQVTGESKAGLPCDPDKKLIAHQSKKDDAGSSNKNKLPHWLREAVNVPPIKPTVPVLPPTVSAIAYSVRLLYGSEKPPIPTFTVPGPPPRPPKDPRKRLKKKGKLHKLRQVCTDTPVFPKTSGVTSSSSVHAVPPLTASTSSTMWADPCSSAPCLNLNLLNSPSALHSGNQCKKSELEIAPSPEALNLVDPCMAPGPPFSPAPCVPSPSDQISDPAAKVSEDIEQSGKGLVRDLKGLRGKRKASKSSLLGCWGKLTEEHIDPAESGDSGKTDSYARQTEQAEVQGIASEETVSVDHRSENEL